MAENNAIKLEKTSGTFVMFPGAPEAKKEKSIGAYCSDGRPKGRAADPLKSSDEFQAIKEYILNSKSKYRIRNYTLIAVGCTLGLRYSDLARLIVRDVFEKDGSVRDYVELFEKKTGKRSKNAITPVAREALELYRDERFPDGEFTLKTLSEPLFCSRKSNSDGTPRAITIVQAYRILQDAAQGANIKQHISTHSLRKTYGYMARKGAAESGVNEGSVMDLLQSKFKHSDQRVTMHYIGVEQEEIDSLALIVDSGLE